MKAVKVPYATSFKDRHGKERWRFRRRGFKTVYLPGAPGDPEWWQAYHAALEGGNKPEGPKRGSVAHVVSIYYRSPEFLDLSDSTKSVYRNILNSFVNDFGHLSLPAMQPGDVKALISDPKRAPTAANRLRSLLVILCQTAIDEGLMVTNPAKMVKNRKVVSKGFHTWTEEDVEAFCAHWQTGTKPRLALDLMLYTAQRRSDAVRMGWQDVSPEGIRLRQQKTGAALLIPIHPSLAQTLADTPRDRMTFLETAYGKPFSAAGFGNWFREQCDTAGLKHCSAHGLRKTAARRLAEAGAAPNVIAAMTGHQTLREVERYTKAASQATLAKAAVLLFPKK